MFLFGIHLLHPWHLELLPLFIWTWAGFLHSVILFSYLPHSFRLSPWSIQLYLWKTSIYFFLEKLIVMGHHCCYESSRFLLFFSDALVIKEFLWIYGEWNYFLQIAFLQFLNQNKVELLWRDLKAHLYLESPFHLCQTFWKCSLSYKSVWFHLHSLSISALWPVWVCSDCSLWFLYWDRLSSFEGPFSGTTVWCGAI